MDLLWSELKFFYKRRVKAWSLYFGVPLCAYLSYALFDSLRNFIEFKRAYGHFYDSPLAFCSSNSLTLLVWLLCVWLTVSKLLAVSWPNEVDLGTAIPKRTDPNDSTVWPPRPKPPME